MGHLYPLTYRIARLAMEARSERIGARIGRDDEHDPELSEYLVRVEWLKTLSAEEAIREKGMYVNHNSATKLRNRFTLDRLAEHSGLAD